MSLRNEYESVEGWLTALVILGVIALVIIALVVTAIPLLKVVALLGHSPGWLPVPDLWLVILSLWLMAIGGSSGG